MTGDIEHTMDLLKRLRNSGVRSASSAPSVHMDTEERTNAFDTFVAEVAYHEHRRLHEDEYEGETLEQGFNRFYREKWPSVKKLKTL